MNFTFSDAYEIKFKLVKLGDDDLEFGDMEINGVNIDMEYGEVFLGVEFLFAEGIKCIVFAVNW